MFKKIIVCCSLFFTSCLEGIVPLPNAVKVYKNRLDILSKEIKADKCYGSDLVNLFLEVEQNIKELTQIYMNIQRDEDNTVQLTKISKLKDLIENGLSLIKNKHGECVKFKVIEPQENGNISSGYTKREDRRPQPAENIEYVQPPEFSSDDQITDHNLNNHKK
jgi:hypothetical protein